MVADQRLALVIRQRGGNNLMLHTRGIPGRVAGRACEEAVTVMGKFAALRGRGDTVNGDNPPTFGFDKLLVAHGRYIVVYRLVNKVWVMAVSPSDGDVFVNIRVVESATKGLVSACQSMEITAEVISKHYAEAYMMMGAVLGYQGTNFGKAQVDALANVYSMEMDQKALRKVKSTKSFKGKPEKNEIILVTNLTEKMRFKMPGDHGRQVEEQLDFPKPAKSPRTQIPIARQDLTLDDDFFNISKQLEEQRKKDAQTVQGLHAADPLDPFSQVPALITAEGNGLTSTPPATTEVSLDDDAFWTSLGKPKSGLPPPKPVPVDDKPLFPLLHVEHWHAKFSGSNIIASSVSSEVVTRPKTGQLRTKFQLKHPAGCSAGLEHSLRSAYVRKGLRSGGGKGVFEGDEPADTVLLVYKLWPGSFLEPAVFRLSSETVPGVNGKESAMIMLIEYATSKNLNGAANGFVDVHVPSKVGTPLSARPKPQWSKKQSRLRWPITLDPGCRGVLRAVFPPQTGLDKLSALGTEKDTGASGFKAEVHLVGKPGENLSGVSLLQQISFGSEMTQAVGSSVWKACIHLQE